MKQIKGKLQDTNIEVVPYELPLDYSYFPADYILKVTVLSLPAKILLCLHSLVDGISLC